VTDWVLNRWKRYGHDRVYAETAGGTRLGYLDMKTNALHPEAPDDLPLLTAAVAGYMNAQAANATQGNSADMHPKPEPIYIPRHEAVDWEDLGGTAPGAAARGQALAHRDAAPVRTALARLLRVHNDERAWRIGADGEQAVATELAKLGPDWQTIHAVPVGENGADIDHVVIGPAGVFTVNAKHHPDANVWVGGNTFIVNGSRTNYIRNSRHEAARAARLLTAQIGRLLDVTALVAVVGAHRGRTIKEQPRDGKVVVVARNQIARYLADRPAVLGANQIEAIRTFACRSTTWRPVN
jgi:hypothetical protein